MNRLSKGFLAFAFLGILALAAAPAQADWFYMHGAGGHIQEMTNIVSSGYFGNGLVFTQKKGTTSYVQFPIPNPANNNWTVSEIWIYCSTGGTNAKITQVDVWDGATKFKTITGKWSGHAKLIKLSLGAKWKIYRGLNVMLTTTVTGSSDLFFGIDCVGANMTDK
jgi:hypothetical protein